MDRKELVVRKAERILGPGDLIIDVPRGGEWFWEKKDGAMVRLGSTGKEALRNLDKLGKRAGGREADV